MANPTIFVSSTFYDLRYVREGVKRFIEILGYTPVLSEDGTVFYDPRTTAAEACTGEVGNADILVLIVGGRYGSVMPAGDQSVTNAEYQQAVARKIPIFALVENGTYNDYQLYRANAADPALLEKINFPHSDSVRIFRFLDEIQGQVSNNALVPFSTVGDVETYLRSQWAGMMHSFLSRDASEAQVVDSLEMLKQVNTRVELLAEQILRTVGTPVDRVAVQLLQEMVGSAAVHDMRFVGARPTPVHILENVSLDDCVRAAGGHELVPEEDEDHSYSLGGAGHVSPDRYERWKGQYASLRESMQGILGRSGVDIGLLREAVADGAAPSGPSES